MGRGVAEAGAVAPGGDLEPLVARVLGARGLLDATVAARFLEPSLKHLHDPSLLPDVDRAAERLLGALERRERIVIYGDYDVDGITATAILFHMLRAIRPDADVRTYVPHRMDEGYGINSEAIAQLAVEGAGVVVSVDCGITAHEPALEARRRGVDLIITDHHTPPPTEGELPGAYAVVHPRRPDSTYPFGDLCGAGVAYKLAWRLATMHRGAARVGPELQRLLVELLAHAALGVIADIVPLVGENRIMARFGLGRLSLLRGDDRADLPPSSDRALLGLRALVRASGLDSDKVDAVDVGFRLAPRLNACGRMGHARDAVELFTTADGARAAELAAQLSRQNNERRAVEKEIFEQAAEQAELLGMTGVSRRAIVLADERWHQGVVGIVCSRLVERYSRPTILLQRREGECHGSGRSVDGFNLHGALLACAPLLERFGGHDMAAGLGLAESRLDEFVEAFMAQANAGIGEDDLSPTVAIDCEATLEELTPDAVAQLERLGPFGRGNPRVRVLVRDGRVAAPPRVLGANGRHLAVNIRPAAGRSLLRVVAWGWGERAEHLSAGSPVDLVVEPKLSFYNGGVTVEPELTDVRPHPAG
jgi:single-stranded-DNA-specific exonuclease